MIKVWAESVCGENPLHGLQTAVFSFCPWVAFLWCLYAKKEGGREQEGDEVEFCVFSSFYKDINPITGWKGVLFPWPHCTLTICQRPLLQIPSRWELWFQPMNLRGTNIPARAPAFVISFHDESLPNCPSARGEADRVQGGNHLSTIRDA